MKIYFVSRKKLIAMLLVSLLLGIFALFSFMRGDDSSVASRVLDPVYQGNSGEKAVAIAVNVDWGEECIPQMLKAFKENNATVTFFVSGKWAEKNPELLKEMKAAGHSIQNHGYKHLHFNNLSAEQASEQIRKAEEIINKMIGERTRFFAPPYGEYNQQLMNVVAALDYELIMWSIDTIDWQRPDSATIVKRVVSKLHNDAIILMHPTDPTVKALPEILGSIKQEGYKMLSIDKIIKRSEGEGDNSN
ncbi:MAG: polysaccharide deacetylase family protein [Syntrophomonas sp.]|uniref:polysaccharide deacetylase family protein n=1 Tax=Syntrophomonas sp. TaxID=2053627 RepID=UPI0026097897|nr:polysaccharide deacetylase family protein [Syntrophomonas sp.]MDD2511105.1 polysaccharide deacetylase family protein [Syntrophomonas sp.]MDD3879585.1 polysaccharide deacetylase family protein [Syntrophomonas sp.]MDD4627253.1 polysaccharide deacetylase family protein [Syntrophomonas sp.]